MVAWSGTPEHDAAALDLLFDVLVPFLRAAPSCLFEQFAALNYSGAFRIFETASFGLPAHRRRAFFAFLDCITIGITLQDAKAKCVEILTFMDRFKREVLPLGAFLLSKNSQYIKGELKRRSAAARGTGSTGAASSRSCTTAAATVPWQEPGAAESNLRGGEEHTVC